MLWKTGTVRKEYVDMEVGARLIEMGGWNKCLKVTKLHRRSNNQTDIFLWSTKPEWNNALIN